MRCERAGRPRELRAGAAVAGRRRALLAVSDLLLAGARQADRRPGEGARLQPGKPVRARPKAGRRLPARAAR